MESIESAYAKYELAKKNKEENGFMSTLEDAYRYCCPRRYNKDEKVAAEIYDSTAIYAVQSRVAANHEALFPAFREWIGEQIVGQYTKAEEVALERQLKKRRDNAHKAIELSNFHTEIEDALTDALFSDGAILVFSGTAENPLRFSVPDWDSFYSLNDMNGEPTNNFMIRKLNLKEIQYYWPKADLSDITKENDDKKMEVIDGYTYDETADKYTYSVFIGKKRIFVSEEKSSPWVIFNQKRRGKKHTGWGQVLDSMPDVKTTNKVEEYLLRHAAINVSGMWLAEDDGVLNPENISFIPGTVIPIAPGSRGLIPLQTQLNMNLTQFVLQDLKENIKKNVQGSALPDFTAGVRTASEYQMRDAEMKKTEVPNMMQLAQGSKRLMRRIFDILESNRMKTSALYCPKVVNNENKVVATSFTSPLANLQRELESKSSLQVIAAMANIFGKPAYDVIDKDNFIKDFYLYNHFNPERILNDDDIKENREKDNQQAVAMAQAGVRQQMPTPGNISL